MSSIHNLRELYGDVYVSDTPDGLVIPWRPLSIGEYFEYENKFSIGVIAPSVLEDEIFRKCVADKVIAENLDRLKAGTVTTVVANIMKESGPVSALEIEQALEVGRQRANQVIHKLVTLICRAFPGYKPDDLYALPFDVFMLRLAQAEDKLIAQGTLQEPISMIPREMAPAQPPVAEKKRPKVDLGKLAQEYAKQGDKPIEAQFRAEPKKPQQMPLPISKTDKVVITKGDMQEHEVLTGTLDEVVKSGMKATEDIYQRYAKNKDASGNVIIPSHEEREAVAKKRAELNEQRYQQYVKRTEAIQQRAKEEAEKIKAERAAKVSRKIVRK